jgi:hypothetical protein
MVTGSKTCLRLAWGQTRKSPAFYELPLSTRMPTRAVSPQVESSPAFSVPRFLAANRIHFSANRSEASTHARRAATPNGSQTRTASRASLPNVRVGSKCEVEVGE